MPTKLLLLLLLLPCLASCTDYRHTYECQDFLGKVTGVEISGCPDGVDPCILRYGGQSNITIHFDAMADDEDLDEIGADGELFYNNYDSDPVGAGYNRDACVDSGLDCPLKPGKSYTYQTTVQFEENYPQPHYSLQWSLKRYYNGRDGYEIVCARVNVRFYTKGYKI